VNIRNVNTIVVLVTGIAYWTLAPQPAHICAPSSQHTQLLLITSQEFSCLHTRIIILPLVVYGCDTVYPILREEHRLRVKYVLFWDVMQCSSCKNRRFGGTYRLHLQGENSLRIGNTLAVTSNCSTLRRTVANYSKHVSSSLIIFALKIVVTTVFENRVLRRLFGTNKEKVVGGWRKVHKEELHNLYSSSSIIIMEKLRRMRC
jgi:hypothetical protein